jgi:hypothetical protein
MDEHLSPRQVSGTKHAAQSVFGLPADAFRIVTIRTYSKQFRSWFSASLLGLRPSSSSVSTFELLRSDGPKIVCPNDTDADADDKRQP